MGLIKISDDLSTNSSEIAASTKAVNSINNGSLTQMYYEFTKDDVVSNKITFPINYKKYAIYFENCKAYSKSDNSTDEPKLYYPALYFINTSENQVSLFGTRFKETSIYNDTWAGESFPPSENDYISLYSDGYYTFRAYFYPDKIEFKL